MTYALGIDVGTTFTAAALWHDGQVEVVPLGDRANMVPSVLLLRGDGVMLVGETAQRRAVTEPTRVAREFKRRMGDAVPMLLDGHPVTAEALTGDMIRWVVEKVAERQAERPAHVTLTCPANWREHRRESMARAAQAAGLTDAGLMTEPSAAAVYYASLERLAPGALVGVYDLGGGTFDATLLRKTEGGFVLCGEPDGDENLGGVDFDQKVMEHVGDVLGLRWPALDFSDPVMLSAVAQVRAHAVEAKEALSSDVETRIPVILPDRATQVRLTRAELEEMVRPEVLRTIATLRRVLEGAQVEPSALHAVLLVGGSSRIPLVSELIAGELRVPVTVDAHPKFAVCLGAAITAASRLPGRQAAARVGPPAAPPRPPVQAPAERPTPPQAPVQAPAERPTAPQAPQQAPVQAPPEPPAPAESPPIPRTVDLRTAGLTDPADVVAAATGDVQVRTVPVTDRDEPLVVHVGGDAYSQGVVVRVLVVVALVALVIGGLTLLALLRR